jgi:hypothetical protein
LVNEALDEKFQITNSKNQTTSKFKWPKF